MQNEVDVNPRNEVVNKLYDVLLSEAELMITAGQESGPAIKQMQVRPNGEGEQLASPGKTLVCKWWGSNNGWAVTSHASFCMILRPWTTSRPDAGGAPLPPTPRRSALLEKANIRKEWLKERRKKMARMPKAKAKKRRTRRPRRKSQLMIFDDGKSEASSSVKTSSTRDDSLINEVTNLLKSMRISTDGDPSVKAMIKQVVYSNDQHDRNLVDGGAIHCLRRATSEEWQESYDVVVHLAT